MQILHTLSGSNLGGLEFRVLDQARWLREQGHAVAIAAPPESETLKLARSWGLATIGMNFRSPYSWSGMLKLRRLVKDLRIQVIDAHGTSDAKATALCRDLCSLVRTWHFARPLGTCWRRRLEWRLGCHRVITTSQGGAQDIVTAGFAAQDRISVVGEWADHGFFVGADKLERRQAARRELGLDPAAFVVATIGMLRPDKRQEDLLRVVHLLRQRGLPAHALVVGMPTRGTMAYGQKLQELVAELGIGGVRDIRRTSRGYRQCHPCRRRGAGAIRQRGLVPRRAGSLCGALSGGRQRGRGIAGDRSPWQHGLAGAGG
ncbi:D-inositol-3-phosphate glycosyltransferase [Achromobacter xylosoxidans]|nr:D-inositol-3-phosphate glycosyltransferase [Achromobacter xylosoxidans]